MNPFHKLIGTGMILLAAAGCAGEEQSQPAPQSRSVAASPAPPTAQGNALRTKASEEAQPPGSPTASAAKSEQKADDGPTIEGPNVENEKAKAAATGISAEHLAAIKELPATEQEIAIKQASCPVSGEPLGSMGKPMKVSAEGRTFYLCCKGCEKDLKADPKSVLAKLDQKRP
jgi:YHS domain-containing protein